MTSAFQPGRPGDVAGLIRSVVLGLVVTHDAAGYVATPLPLLAETGANGEVQAIVGHFARANPHVARAHASPRALICFMGPHGYIPPAWVSKRGWAPTWNYSLAQFEVEIDFQPDRNDAAVRALVAAMEGAGPDAWTVEAMGDRYRRMLDHVVAFRARVIRADARFKLGQDEAPESFAEILQALGNSPLAQAMRDQANERI